MIVPTIIEKSEGGMVGYDIFSRLLKDRIIFIGGPGGALETETANMIIAQRSFQANARTVTASDELMQETVNMKR